MFGNHGNGSPPNTHPTSSPRSSHTRHASHDSQHGHDLDLEITEDEVLQFQLDRRLQKLDFGTKQGSILCASSFPRCQIASQL